MSCVNKMLNSSIIEFDFYFIEININDMFMCLELYELNVIMYEVHASLKRKTAFALTRS